MNQQNCGDYQSEINRLKGQLAGIEKMIASKRETSDIVTQISALRAGLSKLAVTILKDESKGCFEVKGKINQQKRFEELVSSFFKIT